MAFVAKDKNGLEYIFSVRPKRDESRREWVTSDPYLNDVIQLPEGSIAKLIGRELTWEDEPVMIE